MKVRQIILPGEFIVDRDGRKLGRGVYREGSKVFAKVLGIPNVGTNEVSVIPLSGIYMPSVGDLVIGTISEVELNGWLVDINSPYKAFMHVSDAVEEFVDPSKTDISRYYDVEDVILCVVSKSTKNKTIRVSMRDMMAKKLYGGTAVKVTPSKIPRIIGREGSMINLIKSKTGCEILTGENGLVWIKGDDQNRAVKAILTVEKESHTFGLTEKIEKMLSEKK